MKTIISLIGALALAMGTPLAAQVPPSCTCNLIGDLNVGDVNIGTGQTTTASCYVVTVSGQSWCDIQGTISFTYAPVAAFNLTTAWWGEPTTNFTPVLGLNTFVHPIPTQVQCGSGTVASHLLVVGTLQGGGRGAQLSLQKKWSCDSL